MSKRGMTLVELVIALALAGTIFLAISYLSTLAGKHINVYMERYNAYSQIGYALEDMALRLPSASQIHTPFGSSISEEDNIRTEMRFKGSRDVYNITPYEGNTDYWYGIDKDSKALVLHTDGKSEILVEGKFKPEVEFARNPDVDMEPNFCIVVVTANCSKSASIGMSTKVVKAEGIKFLFVDVVSPN